MSSEIRSSKLKNLWFLTLVHLSLLSAFASRVDLSAMSARCLLAYHHPYGLMAICKKFPFITKVLYLSKDRWWRGSLPNSVIQDLVTLSGFLLCTPSLGSGSQWLSIRIVAWQSELIRFGLLWKIYDLVAEKGLAWSPPCHQENLPGAWSSQMSWATKFGIREDAAVSERAFSLICIWELGHRGRASIEIVILWPARFAYPTLEASH